jgi:hypothetical protein
MIYAAVKDHHNNVNDLDVLLQWDKSVKRLVESVHNQEAEPNNELYFLC